jgi:hypothetical protein
MVLSQGPAQQAARHPQQQQQRRNAAASPLPAGSRTPGSFGSQSRNASPSPGSVVLPDSLFDPSDDVVLDGPVGAAAAASGSGAVGRVSPSPGSSSSSQFPSWRGFGFG